MGFSITAEDKAVEQQVFKPFGPGYYNFKVIQATPKTAKTGTRGLHIRLAAFHANREYALFDNIWFTDNEKSRKRYCRVLQCLGVDPEKHPDQDTEEQAQMLGTDLIEKSEVRPGSLKVIRDPDKPEYCKPGWYLLTEETKNIEYGPFNDAAKAGKSNSESDEDIPF